jgi:sugar lactone lactonase YvrE
VPVQHETEVLVTGLCYPECPRWHDGHLWLSDQYDHTVWRIGEDGTKAVAARLDGRPSGLGWLDDGDLLVVSMHDRTILRVGADGEPTVFAALAGHHHGPTNDLLVGPPTAAADELLIYVGDIGFDFYAGDAVADTVLLRVDGAGRASVVADEMVCPNGMAISPGRDRLYVAESLAGRITTFAIAAEGSLHDREVFAELADQRPDGICLDAEGAVWAALARTHEAVRIAPGGDVVEVARSRDNHVYACALGGADRRTLFLCTAPVDTPDEAVARRGGLVETCRVEVPGAGWP